MMIFSGRRDCPDYYVASADSSLGEIYQATHATGTDYDAVFGRIMVALAALAVVVRSSGGGRNKSCGGSAIIPNTTCP